MEAETREEDFALDSRRGHTSALPLENKKCNLLCVHLALKVHEDLQYADRDPSLRNPFVRRRLAY